MDLLRGLELPGGIVGFARGVLEAALVAALMAVAQEISALELSGEAELGVPIALSLLRTLEGLADQIDPKKKRA